MGPVLKSFQKTFKAVVVEEGHRSTALAPKSWPVYRKKAFDYIDAPIKRVAQEEVPAPYSRPTGKVGADQCR
jgi:pyruvate dehydrogenase E1 component beta subunit